MREAWRQALHHPVLSLAALVLQRELANLHFAACPALLILAFFACLPNLSAAV